MLSKRALVVVMLAMFWSASALASQATSKPTNSAKAPSASSSPAPKLSTEDSAKKKELLDSDRFIELRIAFEDWLSVQRFYTVEQIPRLRATFRKKIDAMTPAELQLFLRQSEAKLAILMSPEAIDARDWLGHFVSARAVLPSSEVDQWDVVNMTPAQMEQSLRRVESRRASRASANQAFNTAREASVQSTRAAQNQQRAESARQRSQARSAANASGGSPYAAPPLRRPPPPQRPRPRIIVGPGGPGFIF